jgi:hypothetical protein
MLTQSGDELAGCRTVDMGKNLRCVATCLKDHLIGVNNDIIPKFLILIIRSRFARTVAHQHAGTMNSFHAPAQAIWAEDGQNAAGKEFMTWNNKQNQLPQRSWILRSQGQLLPAAHRLPAQVGRRKLPDQLGTEAHDQAFSESFCPTNLA